MTVRNQSRPGFTPGPWSVPHFATGAAGKCECGYVFSDGYCGAIATVHFSKTRAIEDGDNPPPDEAASNAHLIAAAPDLLETVKRVLDFFEVNMGILFGPGHDIPMAAGASLTLDRLKAVLAKAEGGQKQATACGDLDGTRGVCCLLTGHGGRHRYQRIVPGPARPIR